MKNRLIAALIIMTFAFSGCGSCSKEAESAVEQPAESVIMVESTQEEESEAEEAPETEETEEPAEESIEVLEQTPETAETAEAEETVPEETAETAAPEPTKKEEEPKASASKEEAPKKEEVQTPSKEPEKPVTNTNSQPAPTTPPASTPAPHSCSFDGGTITTNPTCTSEGVKTYKCSCGNTKTEAIAKTSHNYVTESTAATCTEAGKEKIYCSICGDVQSETVGVSAKGHTPGEKKYYYGVAPTCRKGEYYNIYCSVCGEFMQDGYDPALPHTPVETVIRAGDCNTGAIVSISCSVCGAPMGEEHREPTDNHNWTAVQFDVFNEETLEWEKVPGEYCTVCNRQR